MKRFQLLILDRLKSDQWISEEQFSKAEQNQNKNFFSLHSELLYLLYTSVLLLSGGLGILVYQNIDTIGHSVLIGLMGIATIGLYYFLFKKYPGFSKNEQPFEHAGYTYLVLLAQILLGILIGYIQYQYLIFGASIEIVTILISITAFITAYYFDNIPVLIVGITSFLATFGIVITPAGMWEYSGPEFSQIGLSTFIVGLVIVGWDYIAQTIQLKKHFSNTYQSYALHLLFLSMFALLMEDNVWGFTLPITAGLWFYFNKQSHQQKSVLNYTFTLLYTLVIVYVYLCLVFLELDTDSLFTFIIFISPFLLIGTVILIIKLVKDFYKKHHHDSL
ncbi:MAG: DUF2157 domain-containing protein [Cytophagaceae bacterium]